MSRASQLLEAGSLYDTDAKKLKFLKTKGNIVTFKKAFYPSGSNITQMLITKLEKQPKRAGNGMRLHSRTDMTPWFEDEQAMFDAVDWATMERYHAPDNSFN